MSLASRLARLPFFWHLKQGLVYLDRLCTNMEHLAQLSIEEHLRTHLYENARYADPLSLNRREYKVFSQNGEDGIIREIFHRIKTENRTFVEFGVGDGLECNTTYLLTQGWRGLWIEANSFHADQIRERFASHVADRSLKIVESFVTAENIEKLFGAAEMIQQPDLLSIDIDFNDYWIWDAIHSYAPRAVVIEYNAVFPPPDEWVVAYRADGCWDGTSSYFGASLKSLEKLGSRKGYTLVATNFSGLNAFFVRTDLVRDDSFLPPFTAENHYHAPRYFLMRRAGHPRGFGPYYRADAPLP